MNFQNFYLDAVELVEAWNLPDEEYAQVVSDQARLMAGTNIDESGWSESAPLYPDYH